MPGTERRIPPGALFDAAARRLASRPWPVVGVAFALSLAFRLVLAPYGRVFVADEYAYLMKALEIGRGDLVPMHTHAIGWPLFLAPIFALLPEMSLADRMVVVRVVGCLVGSAILVPLLSLGRRMLVPEEQLVLLGLFPASLFLVLSASSGLTEPLFTLLLVAAVACAAGPSADGWRAPVAGVVAGLSYSVRADGLLVFAIVLVVIAFGGGGPRRVGIRLAAAALAFAVAVSPPAAQRAVAFGSPTTFGENDKHFVDEHEHLWSPNIPAPSLGQYLATHGPGDYLDRFVVHGLLAVLATFAWYVVTLPLLPVFLAWAVRRAGEPRFRPLLAVFAVWAGAMTLVFEIHGNDRHLYPTIPFVLATLAAGAVSLVGKHRARAALLAAFLLGYSAVSLGAAAIYHRHLNDSPVNDGVAWGAWIAEHVRGRVALMEHGSFVMMHLPDATVGGVGLMETYAPRTGLAVVRPGYFQTLAEAMAWFHAKGVTHLVLDTRNAHRRPFLREIDPHAPPAGLRLVYSNEGSGSRWTVWVFALEAPLAPAAGRS